MNAYTLQTKFCELMLEKKKRSTKTANKIKGITKRDSIIRDFTQNERWLLIIHANFHKTRGNVLLVFALFFWPLRLEQRGEIGSDGDQRFPENNDSAPRIARARLQQTPTKDGRAPIFSFIPSQTSNKRRV